MENIMGHSISVNNVEAMAYRLAGMADMVAHKPNSRAERRAFEAGCEIAYTLGFGMTPHEIQVTVQDWVAKNPRPHDVSANQAAHKEWSKAALYDLGSKLESIRVHVE